MVNTMAATNQQNLAHIEEGKRIDRNNPILTRPRKGRAIPQHLLVVGRLTQLILAVTKYELNKPMLLTKDYLQPTFTYYVPLIFLDRD